MLTAPDRRVLVVKAKILVIGRSGVISLPSEYQRYTDPNMVVRRITFSVISSYPSVGGTKVDLPSDY